MLASSLVTDPKPEIKVKNTKLCKNFYDQHRKNTNISTLINNCQKNIPPLEALQDLYNKNNTSIDQLV